MIIFKLCPGAYTRGRGKRRALACEMFKMHAYELDTRCAFSISYPEWTSQPTNRLTEKKKRITNVFVMNGRKSIGKIRAIEFMWMCVCALRGERNTQPKRGKINGEHNRKARANFSHSLCLYHCSLPHFARDICPRKTTKSAKNHTHTLRTNTPTKKTSTAFVQKAIKRMTEKRSEVREIVRKKFRWKFSALNHQKRYESGAPLHC